MRLVVQHYFLGVEVRLHTMLSFAFAVKFGGRDESRTLLIAYIRICVCSVGLTSLPIEIRIFICIYFLSVKVSISSASLSFEFKNK